MIQLVGIFLFVIGGLIFILTCTLVINVCIHGCCDETPDENMRWKKQLVNGAPHLYSDTVIHRGTGNTGYSYSDWFIGGGGGGDSGGSWGGGGGGDLGGWSGGGGGDLGGWSGGGGEGGGVSGGGDGGGFGGGGGCDGGGCGGGGDGDAC